MKIKNQSHMTNTTTWTCEIYAIIQFIFYILIVEDHLNAYIGMVRPGGGVNESGGGVF